MLLCDRVYCSCDTLPLLSLNGVKLHKLCDFPLELGSEFEILDSRLVLYHTFFLNTFWPTDHNTFAGMIGVFKYMHVERPLPQTTPDIGHWYKKNYRQHVEEDLICEI